jgi:hypothetical protein
MVAVFYGVVGVVVRERGLKQMSRSARRTMHFLLLTTDVHVIANPTRQALQISSLNLKYHKVDSVPKIAVRTFLTRLHPPLLVHPREY